MCIWATGRSGKCPCPNAEGNKKPRSNRARTTLRRNRFIAYSSGWGVQPVRENHRPERPDEVDPERVELRPHDVERDDGHLRRQHQRDQDDHEHRLSAPPAQAGKCIGDRHARHDEPERREHRVLERVQHPSPQRRLRPDVDEVAPAERLRPQVGRERLVVRHQCGERDEDERREERNRETDQNRVVRDCEQEATPANSSRHAPPGDCGSRRRCRSHRAAPP